VELSSECADRSSLRRPRRAPLERKRCYWDFLGKSRRGSHAISHQHHRQHSSDKSNDKSTLPAKVSASQEITLRVPSAWRPLPSRWRLNNTPSRRVDDMLLPSARRHSHLPSSLALMKCTKVSDCSADLLILCRRPGGFFLEWTLCPSYT